MRRAVIGVVLFILVLALVGAITLSPAPFADDGWLGAPVVAVRRADVGLWRQLIGPGEFVANLLLFVPVGVVLAFIVGTRRWWLAVALCVVGSIAIELVQGALPGRVSDLRDVVANTLGGALGVLVVVLISRRRAARARRARARDRSPAVPAE